MQAQALAQMGKKLATRLFNEPDVRQELWSRVDLHHCETLLDRWRASSGCDPLERRTQLLLFAFGFERLLAEQTDHIFRSPPGWIGQLQAKATPLLRAASIVAQIRRQAAAQLGQQGRRVEEWLDEYFFALAVYGLNTAKFENGAYQNFQRPFALISAGVAAAKMRTTRAKLSSLMHSRSVPAGPYPSYVVPLSHAYRLWTKDKDLHKAEKLLADARKVVDYSVPLRRELALIQATLGKDDPGKRDDALGELLRILLPAALPASPMELKTLLKSCRAFVEIEVPSRIGRIYKDKADTQWELMNISFKKLRARAPTQFYDAAFRCYFEAFQMSRDYYPGGNAAVTALLAGKEAMAQKIAQEVAAVCKGIDLGGVRHDERFWVLATEGSMALLRKQHEAAASFFQHAFDELPAGSDGMAQTSYAQLCRLYRALGTNKSRTDELRPVLEVFRNTTKFHLKPGPLGDCDGLFAP